MKFIEQAAEAMDSLRRAGANVHCITNTVAQNFTANVLLACGATPSMTDNPAEVEFFTRRSDALLLNLGTLSQDREKAMEIAISVAAQHKRPVVLDPVMAHISPPRLHFAAKLLERPVAVLRANQSEWDALEDKILATRIVGIATGKVDEIRWQGQSIRIENGHEMLTTTIATGCAMGALVAALCAIVPDPEIAAVASVLWVSIAGEIAAETANGPGSFASEFLDQLANLTPEALIEQARLS